MQNINLNDGVNRWLDLKDKPEGMNRRSQRYFMEYKQAEKDKGRNSIILFFLITRMGMKECYAMLKSEQKQKMYVRAVKVCLKKYALTQEWESCFRKDIDAVNRRTEHVFRIIRENIRMTEVFPYFQTVGFDRLNDFGVKYAEGDDDASDQLAEEIAEWNAAHPETIAAYMESIAEEKANMEAHRAKVIADAKAEKEARKAERKARKAEEMEIKKNRQAHRARDYRLGVAGSRYYYR